MDSVWLSEGLTLAATFRRWRFACRRLIAAIPPGWGESAAAHFDAPGRLAPLRYGVASTQMFSDARGSTCR